MLQLLDIVAPISFPPSFAVEKLKAIDSSGA